MTTTATNRHGPSDYLTVPLRLPLALSFLFPVADRLGLLGPPGTAGVAWGNFSNFLRYNARVKLLCARGCAAASWGGGNRSGEPVRRYSSSGPADPASGGRRRRAAALVRQRDGDLVRNQIAFRLFGLFSDGRAFYARGVGRLSAQRRHRSSIDLRRRPADAASLELRERSQSPSLGEAI